jgi:hypothetical protein
MNVDPRPDKTIDHVYWKRVLAMCQELTPDILSDLHGLRCGGAELIRTKGSFKLLTGDWDEQDWEAIKEHQLTPVKARLAWLFRCCRNARLSGEGLPEDVAAELNRPAHVPGVQALIEQGSLDL